MRLPSVKFVFDRKHVADDWRGKKENKTKGLIQVEVYYNGRRKWYQTGIKVLKGQWDDSKRVINHPECVHLNNQLGAIMDRIQEKLTEMQRENAIFTLCSLDCVLTDKLSTKDVIVDFRAVSARLSESGASKSRCKNLKSMANNFARWAASMGLDTIAPSAFTLDLLKDYDAYLHTRAMMDSTIYENHRGLKQLFCTYLADGTLKSSPYDRFKLNRPRQGAPRYLTLEELQMVKQYRCKRYNEDFVKDLFLFQVYTGLSFCDATSIDENTRITIEGGKSVLRDDRIKTRVGYTIVLLEQAKEILDRYDRHLDRYSLANVDLLLKRIGMESVGRPLSSHMARHTFATLALSKGVPIEYVSKMLGHSSIVTTQRYARVLAQDVIREFDKLTDL